MLSSKNPDIRIINSRYADMETVLSCNYITSITSRFYPSKVYDIDKYVMMGFGNEWRIFISKKGNEIIIDDDCTILNSALIVSIGSALSLCFVYKGFLPLHTAVFCKDNKMIGIMAPSGTGKSSLLWSFINRGAYFVTDDVLPVEIHEDTCIGYPSVSMKTRLHKNTLQAFGVPYRDEAQVHFSEEKYWLDIDPSKRIYEKRKLDVIYLLSPYQEDNPSIDKTINITSQPYVEKVNSLVSNIHFVYGIPLNDRKRLLYNYSNLYNSFDMYKIEYKKTFSIIDDIVDKILTH